MNFNASNFTPTKWEGAEQKAKFANHFIRFVMSDFKFSLFPEWFYKRLSMTFGHIAHYNRLGFYDNWFKTEHDKKIFILHALNNGGFGDPAYTYSDVENAIKKWIRSTNLEG